MKRFLLGLLAAVSVSSVVMAQSIPVPQLSTIGNSDLFQDLVSGQPSTSNYYVSGQLLSAYVAGQPGNNAENALIGGDFGLNLFAYGTSVTGITTTPTGVANRWFAWSGTSTTLAGNQETGATDIPANYQASLRITRSGAGVVQSCVLQEVETVNSIAFQGQTAEFDFHALAGSGFSAASSNLVAYFLTGTGTDEGYLKAAFSINAGGGLAVGWTGAVLKSVTMPISTAWNRYTVAFPTASTATEAAVALCWTPVGASPSSDWFEFTGAQLSRNSALTALAGTAGAVLPVNTTSAKAFVRRTQALETVMQERYYWNVPESGTIAMGPAGVAKTNATAFVYIPNPVTMRTTPTPLAAFGSMQLINSAGNVTTLTGLAATASGSSANGIQLTATVPATTLSIAPPQSTLVTSNSGTGNVGADAEMH